MLLRLSDTVLLPLTLPLREAEGKAEEEKVTAPVRVTDTTVGVRTALAVRLTEMELVSNPVAVAEVEAVREEEALGQRVPEVVPLPFLLLLLLLALALVQRLALALVLGQRVRLKLPVKVEHTLALAEELPPARLALPQFEGMGCCCGTRCQWCRCCERHWNWRRGRATGCHCLWRCGSGC